MSPAAAAAYFKVAAESADGFLSKAGRLDVLKSERATSAKK